MAIPKGYKANFETLQLGIKAGRSCLLECKDKATGKNVYVVCVTNPGQGPQGDEIEIVPVAKLFDGNPYDELIAPLD